MRRYNLVTDYQGSVIALVSTTGALAATYKYDPYGGSTATGPSAGDNPFHYLGQYQYGVDMLLGYRWYFPGWGRFTTPDPTGQEACHYAYAQDDPISHSDPREPRVARVATQPELQRSSPCSDLPPGSQRLGVPGAFSRPLSFRQVRNRMSPAGTIYACS
ncbi:RHS repeat-associated core domain-containing protein [Amycolatopsis sp. NBC_01480]|uniref:RHS repeat-associated core domain-containing protein n=1 Tax=Amycolatopsis sp. NBC_01480 TaxID=2903562 RepID=UPI002E288780|nr:RHS repeat-associated core domain-containing protein [Amycolatopsis sp. NBC_01480]